MDVDILSTTLIRSPPPVLSSTVNQPLLLSHLDGDRILHFPFRTLRLYSSSPSPPADDPADVIAAALSSALVLYAPLSAPLRLRPSNSRLEVSPYDSIPAGILFTRAASSLTVTDLCARPGASFLDQFAPNPTYDEAVVHPLALQVTALACRGFAGMSVHHSLCDGSGATQFLSTVAGFARGSGQPKVAPVWERAELLGPREPPRVELTLFRDVLGFDDIVACSGPYAVAEENVEGPSVRECFYVNEACFDRFRNRLSQEAAVSFTTFEVLSAYIWRARVQASGISCDETVKLVYSMNIKKLLKLEIPAGYWGNVCVPVYIHLSAGELVEQPLWKTAKLIKASKHNVSDEYVRSYIDFQELHFAKGITAGKRVSAFTDWRHLGHSDVDFGWGGPMSVMPLSWRLLGSLQPCFFLPNYANEVENSGFRVLISIAGEGSAELQIEHGGIGEPLPFMTKET